MGNWRLISLMYSVELITAVIILAKIKCMYLNTVMFIAEVIFGGEDSDSFKVTDVLEYIECGILRYKGEERSLSQQTSVLDILVTIRDSFNVI